MVGGGITILASRTLDAAGGKAVVFTSGHVAFRQSLLVRAEDAGRIRRHGDLGGARVGVLAGTTGEARLLALTGLADSAGFLAAGARVRKPRGEVVADGSAAFAIRASGASPLLAGRTSIESPSADMPRVVYLGAKLGETELLAALREGRVERGGAGRNRQSRRGPRLGRRVRGDGPGPRGRVRRLRSRRARRRPGRLHQPESGVADERAAHRLPAVAGGPVRLHAPRPDVERRQKALGWFKGIRIGYSRIPENASCRLPR